MAGRIVMRSKYRDLNARGRGYEAYRMLATIPPEGEKGALFWAEDHPASLVKGSQRLPATKLRAADRSAACKIETDSGLLVVEIRKQSYGGIIYRAGMTVEGDATTVDFDANVQHIGVKKNGGTTYTHVVEIDGKRVEFAS